MDRVLLRSQLINAWDQTIKNQYAQRLINSERGLQVYFCTALLKEFDQAKLPRRIFIEPRLDANSETRYPDLVICNSQNVIGVVELKYLPRVGPDYTKDLETLKWIATHSEGFVIANERYLGPEKPIHYGLADNAILCWAGVYKGPKENIRQKAPVELHPRFLEMHALTDPNQDPTIDCI